ncbi:universal stress protein [Haladaptatus caseinilyticus]|uniref:universal stress protein n=1 Tax=Haladaptatus caseinilyticus TaxID=2993314 RepID=UPI00224A5D66|nr:universal stress protein [Haladaptatus caseinilyticus]
MFSTLLLPIDGSDTAQNAIPYALELAEQYEMALHIVSVVETDGTEPDEKRMAMYEEFEVEAKQMVEDVIAQAGRRDIRTTAGSIAEGKPQRAILQYAAEQDVDLIVMGTHGRSGFRHALRRSVTEKVIRRAEAPVLAIRLVDSDHNENTHQKSAERVCRSLIPL